MTDDIERTLAELSPDAITAKRAAAINAGRDAGMSWRAIAEALGMTQNGIQRMEGVNSPRNARKDEAA